MSQTIDPHDHLGLVMLEAARGARQYGGDTEEWVGPAFLAVADAARTFDPSLGFAFSTHCVKAIRWKLLAEHRRRCWGRPTAGAWRYLPVVGQGNDPERDPLDAVAAREPMGATAAEAEELWEAIDRVSPRGAAMARLLTRGLTPAQVAREFGLSRERVRQIVTREVRPALAEHAPGEDGRRERAPADGKRRGQRVPGPVSARR